MTTRILNSEHFRRRAFFTLFAATAFCIITYVYLLNVTIKHSVAIDDAATQIANLRVTVSTLEESYFSAQNRLTLSKAQSLGFQTMKNVTYLSKKTAGSLSLNIEAE